MIPLSFTFNNLNRFEAGILLIVFGIIFSAIFKYFHKAYKNEGYKPFKPFRRDGKTQTEDNLFIFLYMRSLVCIYLGYFIIAFGIISIIYYFIKK